MLMQIFLNYTLTLILLGVFLKGYFPLNKYEPKPVEPPRKIGSFEINPLDYYKPTHKRLILVVIDALRVDFVTEEYMPYTFRHKSCLVPVKVEAPTVTMPRIKAITTGNVPQFADIILNVNMASRMEDSFLHRAHSAGKKIVFYGDNTWLNLYPDLFLRQEGTNSFFVKDFHEVDDNVTRHLNQEMRNDDWDMLILHYLGLDHIGHVLGPFSGPIKPKLHEMDSVIETLHKSDHNETLLLVTGDHGMKDSGSHGGTTFQEVHVPLIAFGSTCGDGGLARQTDIPATLSALFGVQMNAAGIGKMIPDFFTGHERSDLLYILNYNFRVLFNRLSGKEIFIRNENDDEINCSDVPKMHGDFFDRDGSKEYLIKSYEGCLKEMSEVLIRSCVEQDVYLITFAIISSITSLILIIREYLLHLQNQKTDYYLIIPTYINTILFVSCYYLEIPSLPLFILISFILSASGFIKLIKTLLRVEFKNTTAFACVFLIILHGFLLQSTSFIEEEHQVWFFYTGTVSLVLFYANLKQLKCFKINTIFALSVVAVLRFTRTLNSTGDKFASYPDLADWFMLEANSVYYKLFHATGLLLTYLSLISLSKKNYIQKSLYALTLFLIFIYKMCYNYNNLAQIIWGLIIVTFLNEFFARGKNLFKKTASVWVLVITLLLQPHNTILIPSCFLSSYIYRKNIEKLDFLTIAHLWLGSALYFCQGHSNSFASVDLSVGYTGLSTYIPSLIIIFTLCHMYAFPVLSNLLLLTDISDVNKVFTIYILKRLWVLIVIYIAVLFHLKHLFVWSVFAPKLIIEAGHTAVLFMYICFVKLCLYFTNKGEEM